MENKKPWQSKTNWAALIVAVSAFIPSVGQWIAANPETYGMALGALFAALRAVTKGKIGVE